MRRTSPAIVILLWSTAASAAGAPEPSGADHEPAAPTAVPAAPQGQLQVKAVRGPIHWGIEAYELVAPLGGRLATLAGASLTLRREADAFYIGARASGSFDPGSGGVITRLRLARQLEAQVEMGAYASPASKTSLFVSGMLGFLDQRFEGPATLDGPGAVGVATSAGVSVAVRVGVEALRASELPGLFFLQLELPTFTSRDAAHGVIDRWVPSAWAGGGVLF